MFDQNSYNIDDFNSTQEVSLRELYDFKNHPFHVNDDEEMLELIRSVKEKERGYSDESPQILIDT